LLRVPSEGSGLEQKYWLGREKASIRMAYLATSAGARKIHLDLAALLKLKAESINAARLLQPLSRVAPFVFRRPAKSRPMVLVCDDEELVVDLLEHHLRNAGYEVARAADGAIALEQIRRQIPRWSFWRS
jgi:PleD family two-component response regulator